MNDALIDACRAGMDKDGFLPPHGAYPVAVLADGAQRISYPPSCPSHRRDRALYTAYAGCRRCQGRGVIHHDGPYGSYPGQCPACAVIAYGRWRTALTEWRQARLRSLTDQFEALLRGAENKRRKEQLSSDALFLAAEGERYRSLLRTAWGLDRMP